jgi:hypothetical protein
VQVESIKIELPLNLAYSMPLATKSKALTDAVLLRFGVHEVFANRQYFGSAIHQYN